MIFRKLRKEDATAYWTLRLEALENEPRAFGQSPADHLRSSIDDAIALLCAGDGFVIGAFDQDALVAIARFSRETAEKERHKGHVYGVYVAPSHRGRGVARSVIETLAAAMRDDPTFDQLLISAGTFNDAARAVYRSLGFLPYGIEPRATKVGSEYFDEEHMILRLR